jgi:hypothetical protein
LAVTISVAWLLFSTQASAVAQIELPEPCEVSRGDLEVIRRVDRRRASEIKDVTGYKVLHPDRFGDPLVECVADLFPGFLFEDRP